MGVERGRRKTFQVSTSFPFSFPGCNLILLSLPGCNFPRPAGPTELRKSTSVDADVDDADDDADAEEAQQRKLRQYQLNRLKVCSRLLLVVTYEALPIV